jgi:hypothetical protein
MTDKGAFVTPQNMNPTYEDAARDYLMRFRALMQHPAETDVVSAPVDDKMPSETFEQHAQEIAHVSCCMIQLVQDQLDSASSMVRDGIMSHFIDQAAAEFLLGAEMLQTCIKETGMQSTAANRATYSAALRESAGAIEKSSSVPLAQGLPTGESCRTMKCTTMDEAVSALEEAVADTTGNITRRVQELGKDIAFDLIEGTPWVWANERASLSRKEITGLLESGASDSSAASPGILYAAAGILANSYLKISALLSREIEPVARHEMADWLAHIQQTNKVDLFDAMVEKLFGVGELRNSVRIERSATRFELESINRTSGLLKSLSEKFTILTERMRKLEDAIRLGKLIRVPQLLTVIASLQIVLLAVLVYSGHDYIKRDLAGILRARGFLEA